MAHPRRRPEREQRFVKALREPDDVKVVEHADGTLGRDGHATAAPAVLQSRLHKRQSPAEQLA